MFVIKLAKGFEMVVDSFSEVIRYFNPNMENGEAVVIFSVLTTDNYKVDDLKEVFEGNTTGKIDVYENNELVNTVEGFNQVVFINKSLRPNKMWYYDIQLKRQI